MAEYQPNPIYQISETQLITRRVSHPLIGEIAVMEDQPDGRVLMTYYLGGDYAGTYFFDSLEYAFEQLNAGIVKALEEKFQVEIEKIKNYRSEA